MPNIGSLLLAYALGTCVSALSPAAVVAQSSAPVKADSEPGRQDVDAKKVGDIQPRIDRWNLFLEEIHGRADAAERIEAYRKKHGVPLSFWEPEAELAEPPRFLASHPCGADATVFVDRLPAQEDAITGDTVHELDAVGKTVHEWVIPMDTRVEAVKGKEILVPIPFWKVADPESTIQVDTLLSIRSDGRFRVLPPRQLPDPQAQPCPASLPESAYWTCWVYRDLDGGKARHMAYEGPCT
jgi:hypothetical protein